jgi:hypothetical protein
MSVRRKVLAAVVTLALAGGISVTGLLTARAATPPCGRGCIDPFSRAFGTRSKPAFVLDVFRRGNDPGQPVILYWSSNADPAEDFTVSAFGTVADFYAAGLVSAALNQHYSKFEAYEIQYSPYGVDSGLCMGVPVTAADGTKVSLQPCGESAKTVWVADSHGTIKSAFVPLINGSDTDFSRPYVLTYPARSLPADVPRPQLVTRALATSSGGAVFDSQLWSADAGVLP